MLRFIFRKLQMQLVEVVKQPTQETSQAEQILDVVFKFANYPAGQLVTQVKTELIVAPQYPVGQIATQELVKG